jgi:hypothetical protein
MLSWSYEGLIAVGDHMFLHLWFCTRWAVQKTKLLFCVWAHCLGSDCAHCFLNTSVMHWLCNLSSLNPRARHSMLPWDTVPILLAFTDHHFV